MKIDRDYHVHSILPRTTHAKSSIEEIVLEAINKGLKEIAISNHGLAHIRYGFRKNHIPKLKAEINALNEKYPQIKILLGVEANILSLTGDTDIEKEILENCDVILCGYHLFVEYKSFNDFWNLVILNWLAKKFGFRKEKQRKINTQAIVEAMNKNKMYLLTHPGRKLIYDIEEIAKAASKNNILLEINNNCNSLSVEEIKLCEKYDVKYMINSDSHIKDTVGNYETGLKRAIDAGLNLDKIVNIEQ